MPENKPSSSLSVTLRADGWMEIYYALDTKIYDVRNGGYEEEDDSGFLNEWADQLTRIMKTIGPDGTEAAARGVGPCDMPKRPTAESPGPLTIGRIQ